MTVVASIEALAIVVCVALLLRYQAAQATAWALERRELLNRIQRPEMLPFAAAPQYVLPEPEVDDLELVGTIAYLEPEA